MDKDRQFFLNALSDIAQNIKGFKTMMKTRKGRAVLVSYVNRKELQLNGWFILVHS